MPKQPTILVAVRVPADLVERVDARGSRTEVVLEGLRVLLDGVRPSVWQEADVILLDHATARADAAERRVVELESQADKIVPIRKAAKAAAVGQLLITLPPEVIQLMPGDDKVATIEAHLIERFGYGMYRVKQLLKPEDKKGKRP